MDVDVTKLKCIYWSLVKNIVEAEAYGINCNLKKLKEDALLVRSLISALSVDCTIPYAITCVANSIVKTKGSTCVLISDTCTTRFVSDYEVIGIIG